MSTLTVIVLTFNEQQHIERCLRSVSGVASEVIVVDSFSSDRTVQIAQALGATVFSHHFYSHASQFNWALDNCNVSSEWILKLDADEYLTPELVAKVKCAITEASSDVSGFTVNLRRIFLGRWIRFGGIYPIKLLRIWRKSSGRLDERFMDEHVHVSGRISHINFDLVDHNLNSLAWWTAKHNRYSSLEALSILLERTRGHKNANPERASNTQTAVKRFIKHHVYLRMRGEIRAGMYFLYRYLFRLGFADGSAGLIFHVLQGFWYRFLVDAKLFEVNRLAREDGFAEATFVLRSLELDFLLPQVGIGIPKTLQVR